MLQENILKRRCRQTLYKVYSDYLGDEKKEKFDEIKENDPYLNQIIDEVLHYVVYDLPLQPLILDAIHGVKHAGS